MDESFDTLIVNTAFIVAALLCLTFCVFAFNVGSLHDKQLAKEVRQKESIYQSYAYLDGIDTMSSSEVIVEIINSKKEQKVYLNGVLLNADKVDLARDQYLAGISYLKNTFTRNEYEKTYVFAEDGKISGIDYR